MLEWGADDYELRRFFADSRFQLIQKGARVQNLPHGKPARVRMLVQGLPTTTDRLVQKWFSEHLTMLDPKSVTDLVADLRLYEEAGESPPEDEAKRLARSCLVHLFSIDPPAELMSFLRPEQVANVAEPCDMKETPTAIANEQNPDSLSVALGQTIVALTEGRDPDEFLSSLPPATASFVAGVYAVRSGRDKEAQIALEALDHHQEARALLTEYVGRSAAARTSGALRGLQMLRIAHPDDAFSFNFDHDEVIAVCTRDYPETTVFVHPFAIRAADGSWIDLSSAAYREKLFYSSGDLIAFPGGRDTPRQPKRGEIGIWRVAENNPLCLKEQSEPYFALHWRFKVWRWCPEHNCLMEDNCPHCGAVICLPANMCRAGPERRGVGRLSLCLVCERSLINLQVVRWAPGTGVAQTSSDSVELSEAEELSLVHGRALLATLALGYYRWNGHPTRYGLRSLAKLERMGFIVNREDWLSANSLRNRTVNSDTANLLTTCP